MNREILLTPRSLIETSNIASSKFFQSSGGNGNDAEAVALNNNGRRIWLRQQLYSVCRVCHDAAINTALPISNLPIAPNSQIFGVAMNDLGQALIGGYDSTKRICCILSIHLETQHQPHSKIFQQLGKRYFIRGANHDSVNK